MPIKTQAEQRLGVLIFFLSRRIIILPVFALKCFLGELFLQGKED